ncbi:MAG: transporter substrate-binding domain-containing protein [Chloroflexota bacterium]
MEDTMHKLSRLTALLGGVVIVAAACSTAGGGASTAPSAAAPSAAASSAAGASAPASAAASAEASVDPKSLLGLILSSGKVRISTDPNYKPFSFLNTTTGKYEGFDTSTAEETVKRLSAKLGKEIAVDWQTPGWDTITSGSWGGRWDISIGSMSVTVERAKHVDFADPYYYDSGAVAVPVDSKVQSLSELNDGKTFCVGQATTYEQWLNGTLAIVDPNIVPAPTTPNVTSLPTDNECVQAVNAGRKFDAIVANANGLADAVKSGAKIRVLDGPPIFTVSVAFALDKSGPNDAGLLKLLNEIVADMHADGTLKGFSEKWLGKDVTTKPS